MSSGFAVRLAWGALLAIVVFGPIPYGSFLPWAWHLLGVLAALGLVALAVARDRPPVWPWELRLAALAFLLAVGFGLLQGTPAELLRPWAHPIWNDVTRSGLDGAETLAVSPEGTRDNAARLLTYGAVFLLAFALARRRERARALFRVVFAVIALEAAYGLLNHFAGWQTVLWEKGPKAYAGYVTGTFINRNTFATYTALGLLLGLALLIESLLRTGTFEDFRRRLVALAEEIVGRRGLLLVALLLVFTAHLLTGSRGGLLSLAVAFLVFVAGAFAVTRPRRRTALAALAALLLFVGGMLWLAGDVTFARLMQADMVDNPRTVMYARALDMIADRPWLGHGLGGFADTFQLYRDDRLWGFWDRAHDTYLEHAVELGLPATVLLYLGPLLVFGRLVHGLRTRRRQQIFPLVGVSTTVLVATHALVDFSLQIPGMAVTYAAVLGAAYAQSLPRPLRRPELFRATAGRARIREGTTPPVAAPSTPRGPAA